MKRAVVGLIVAAPILAAVVGGITLLRGQSEPEADYDTSLLVRGLTKMTHVEFGERVSTDDRIEFENLGEALSRARQNHRRWEPGRVTPQPPSKYIHLELRYEDGRTLHLNTDLWKIIVEPGHEVTFEGEPLDRFLDEFFARRRQAERDP